MRPLAAALEQLLGILDRFEVPFLIGGSIASGMHSMPRATNDVDILADFRSVDVAGFCEYLRHDFYVDPETVAESVRSGRPFNIIHSRSVLKFDFFPANDAFAQSEIARRCFMVSAIPGLENIEMPICSPEDCILSKLTWFRTGGEVSDRQWHDILSVIHVQRGRLDHQYLALWAERLHLSDLLAKALSQRR